MTVYGSEGMYGIVLYKEKDMQGETRASLQLRLSQPLSCLQEPARDRPALLCSALLCSPRLPSYLLPTKYSVYCSPLHHLLHLLLSFCLSVVQLGVYSMTNQILYSHWPVHHATPAHRQLSIKKESKTSRRRRGKGGTDGGKETVETGLKRR